ncbi:uncharacterized protein LOC127911690 isoform X1 [Oncorhynchus keta]|uniref:uncharacterized protein LOC127911690 isoform X1 n=1 Tax=Oncorhynchus keta TaxID=8018 RepID=UPI00227C4D08|nr:uncharacterized protein LOC127911690 isoform X1 [Oncorhynchus keta]
MWQGLQSITDYIKKTSTVTDQDVLLPGRLNNFFARFEDNTVPLTRPATKTCGLSFTAADVRKTFKRVNPRKAAGPDGIPSRALRACADQLSGVFTDIFNQSLSQSVVPTCFKRATIVPVPKKAKVTELNDYRPVALTSDIMKCFEGLVKDHITSTPPDTLDPLQFAYRPNRSTDDAISTTLHTALTHLDKRNTYVRMLFIIYSSAFNTIVPSKLVIKLETLGPDPALCNWVLDFLTGRPQVVRVGKQHLHPADPQHWGPTRVRFEPSTVLPVHPRLRGHARLQLNHQVCGRHNSGRLDYQQRRDGLQGGGEGPRSVVSGK